MDVTDSADTQALMNAYERFRAEASELNSDYQPETVNTDGWEHTQAAWRTLFPNITIVLCFLHTVLDIQQRCRRTKALWQKLTGKLWHVYNAKTQRQFAQRLRRLGEWAATNVKQKTVRQKLLNLTAKSAKFQTAYDFPDAYRTSNSLDRAQELSRPPTVPDAVFSWQPRFNSVASASNGIDLELPSLQQQKPLPVTRTVLRPLRISTAFATTTIGYATCLFPAR